MQYQSASFMQTILNNIPHMAWYKDTEGKFLALNQAFAASIGKPLEDILGKTDFDVWAYDLALKYTEDDAKVIRAGKQITVEETIDDKRGGLWYETIKTPVFDENNIIIGTVGISKDITVRKRIQHDLEIQKRFLKELIDAIPDLIFFKDSDSKYIGCNTAFARNFIGLSEEEIIGKTDIDFLKDKKLAEFFRQKDIEALGNRSNSINEEIIQLSNGEIIEVETSKTPFYDEHGNVAGLIGVSRDITSRNDTTKALKEKSEYSEMLLRMVPSAVYTLDNDMRITSWNNMASVITGYSAEEVMGKRADMFNFHPCRENCGLFSNPIIAPEFNLICKMKHKDGMTKHLLKNVDVLRNSEGKIIGRIECFDDITDRILIENQLKQSELRLSLATNNGNIGLWDWNVQTGETYFNEQWANMIGYTLEELQPVDINTWVRFTHPEDLQKSYMLLEKCFNKETNLYENEIRLKHRNGSWVWVIDRGRVVEWDKNNKPLRVLGTHIDITNRKLMEEELYNRELLLAAVADSIKELISDRDYLKSIEKCFDLLGNATKADRVYLFSNYTDELGNRYTRQVLEWNSGEKEPQIDNPELKGISFEEVSSFLEPLSKGEAYFNIVSQLKNDRTRELLESQEILSLLVIPIFVQGIFWGYVGFDECKYERIWTDSEFATLSAFAHSIEKAIQRSMIETELEAARQTAEAANLMKSQFLANMSHEIRTPMHAILGYTDLLGDSIGDEQGKGYLSAIKKSGNMLLSLINDILDLSKIESGKMEIQSTFLNIRKLFSELKDVFMLKAKEKGNALLTDISEELPEVLYMDEIRTRQILFNLVGNAVKFTENGKVTASVYVINKNPITKKLDVVFRIKDTGIGIPQDQFSSIFDPFKQKDGQSNKKYGGTGLGLSITKRLINMMGGTLTLESKVGEGSIFTVVLPEISINNPNGMVEKEDVYYDNVTVKDEDYIEPTMEEPEKSRSISLDMYKELENLRQGIWQDCKTKNRMNDIRKFAGQIQDIGVKYNHKDTLEYATELLEHVRSFNLKNIKSALDLFEEIFCQYVIEG